jgi:hypothetical protein
MKNAMRVWFLPLAMNLDKLFDQIVKAESGASPERNEGG